LDLITTIRHGTPWYNIHNYKKIGFFFSGTVTLDYPRMIIYRQLLKHAGYILPGLIFAWAKEEE
jgi:hypothetical protein